MLWKANTDRGKDCPDIYTKIVKQQVYSFPLGDCPEEISTSLDNETEEYRIFRSERLTQRSNNFFKPKLEPKKLFDEPKFFLSLERRKQKIINGANQQTSAKPPSRNSYRGVKIKSRKLNFIELPSFTIELSKRTSQKIAENIQAKTIPTPAKQPSLHFNLHHIINQRKIQSKIDKNNSSIQGSNQPYYNYFASEKSFMSQRGCKSRHRHYSSLVTTPVQEP